MPTTVDSLQIEIKASADSAKQGIESLCKTLEKLKSVTTGTSSLDSLASSLRKFDETVRGSVTAVATGSLKQLGEALNSLKGLQSIKLPTKLGSQISDIMAGANTINLDSVVMLGVLAPALQKLSGLNDISISSTIGKGITDINAALSVLDTSNLSKTTEIATALSALSGVQNVRLSSSLANQLINLGIATEQIQDVDFSSLTSVADAIGSFQNISKTEGLSYLISQLKRLPEAAQKLNECDISTFVSQLNQISSALAPLASNVESVTGSINRLPSAVSRLSQSTSSGKTSATDLLSMFKMAYSAAQGAANAIGGMIKSSNSYIESMNLVNASLGTFAVQAQDYANKVADVLGIDPSEWLEAQGVFYNLADGFGIASDRAYTMSQQLTQLSYDLASFYNLSVNDAMLKIRGGLSGEIEMMRQLGVDLSNAAMQEKATAMGISTKVTAMTQAEKAQLRYTIMMERTTTAQGDMARTLSAPANQLRVLSAQFTQAARAIGNVFIPVLNSILPVITAVVKAIRILASSIASLFGFSLPEVDYSGISDSIGSASSGVGDLSDGLGSAGNNAKKLKDYMMGIDELNVIDSSSSGGSGGGGGGGSGGGGGGDGFDWDLATYDFLGDAVSSAVDSIYAKIEPVVTWIQEHLTDVLSLVEAIGAALLMWQIAKTFVPELALAQGALNAIKGLLASVAIAAVNVGVKMHLESVFLEEGSWGAAIGTAITTALSTVLIGAVMTKTFSASAGYYAASINLAISAGVSLKALWNDIVETGGDFNAKRIIQSIWSVLQGAAAGGVIGFKLGGVAGAAVGAAAGATITLTANVVVALNAYSVHQSAIERAKMWGSLILTAAEIKSAAEALLSVDVDAIVDVVDTQIQNDEEAKEALNQKIVTFNSELNKVLIGVEYDQEDVTSLTSQLTGEGGIISALQESLNQSASTIELAVSLVPPKNSEGEDMSFDILTNLGVSSNTILEAATDAGNKLSQALQDGYANGLENGLDEQIANLAYWVNRLTTGAASAESVGKFNLGVKDLLANVTEDSFGDIIDAYAEKRSELEESLRSIQEQARNDTATLLEELKVSRDYYESMGGYEDKVAELDKAIAEYEETLANWDLDASVAAAMKEKTEEAFTLLVNSFREHTFTDESSSALSSQLSQYISNGFEGMDLTNIDSLAENVDTRFWVAVQDSMSAEDFQLMLDMSDKLGVSGLNLVAVDIQQEFVSQLAAQLGSDKAKAVLTQMGYDMTELMSQGLRDGSVTFQSAGDGLVTVVSDTLGEVTLQLTPELKALFKELGIELPSSITEGMEEGVPEVQDAATELGNAATTGTADAVADGTDAAVASVENSADTITNSYLDEAKDNLEDGKGGITAATETAMSGVDTTITNTLDDAEETIVDTTTEACSGMTTNVSETASASVEAVEEMSEGIIEVVNETVAAMAQSFEDLCTSIVDNMNKAYTTLTTQWGALASWFITKVTTPVGVAATAMATLLILKFTLAKTAIQTAWVGVATWFNTSVFTPLKTYAGTIQTALSSGFISAKSASQRAWEGMPEWFSESVVQPIIETITGADWYHAGQAAMKSVKSGMQSVSMSTQVKWSTVSTSVNGQTVSTKVPEISLRANGGFPSRGELFVAREAGAEMVGSLRGRTAVANNDQIVEGIYEGVRAAMLESNSESGQMEVKVYLDGKQISASVEKYQHRRGATIYPRGVVGNV